MRRQTWMPCIVLIVCFATASQGAAAVRLNPLFSDHMVIQRERPVPVWGTAAADKSVTVAFAGQAKSAIADAGGRWRVTLDPLKASAEPGELRAGEVVVHDVLVGEVWLDGGQSNMGLPLAGAHNSAETLPKAGDPQLRLFKVALKTAAEPQSDVSGQWKVSTPESAKDFSAVAYFFARDLRQAIGCPVGVIAAPWGGTPIETWIGLQGLKQDPPLTRTLGQWEQAVEQHHRVQEDPQLYDKYTADLRQWRKEVEPAFNAASKAWLTDKQAGKPVGPRPVPARPEPQNPDPMTMPSPSRRPNTPSVSFNGMIAPLAPFALRGVIWYQGEANGSAGVEYRTLFPRLIEDWRKHWETEFPFLFVQLPANGLDLAPVAESGWPWLREAQFMTLRLPHTGMAITIDLGDPNNVHPTDKLDVGRRLALIARRDVYGEKVVASGPLYRDFRIDGDAIRVRFVETGAGLTAGQAPWRPAGVEPLPTDRLIGFYVAGENRLWTEAQAKIDSDSVIVSSPSVSKPVAVRYGWANSPRCNLYNRDGLPAAPFRTDDWSK